MLTSKNPFSQIRSGSMMPNKPPPFMDMSSPSYQGIPPLPTVKLAEGGVVVEKPMKKKQHPFKRM